MPTYNVSMTRLALYYCDVQMEAESEEDAERQLKERPIMEIDELDWSFTEWVIGGIEEPSPLTVQNLPDATPAIVIADVEV